MFPKPYGFVILNAVKDLMLYLRFFAALRKRNRVDQKITSSRTLVMTGLLELILTINFSPFEGEIQRGCTHRPYRLAILSAAKDLILNIRFFALLRKRKGG
ncbi:hypothetical protein BFP97_11280 [Roseivirga sp. 4D4]|nr:hypothetical protein BFP97_11280 [Roseivirga sp. 4D4]